jgi:tRNA(fMet)-specific endonuclease VapC
MYMLDSSTLIELLEKGPHAEKVATFLGNSPIVTASVCMHEVLAGVSSPKDRFVLEGLFTTFRVLPHDASAARIGSQMHQDLRKRGKMMNPMDILIAAVCKVHDAELVTLDKGFKNIKGARVHILT